MSILVSMATAVIENKTVSSAVINVQGAAISTGALENVDTVSSPMWVQFNTTGTGTPGVARLMWNDTDGTLEFQMKGGNVTQQIGMEQLIRVKAADNGGLIDGKVVYATGSDGTNINVAYAQANGEVSSSRTLAVMTEGATGGAKAYATTFGLVHDLDTSALTEGAAIWLSPTVPGGMTTTKPSAPNHLVFIGYCLRQHATVGTIFVSVQNGYELEELHNVSITSPANNEVLTYEASSGLWKNKVNAADGVTSVTASAPLTGGTITSTGTIGLDQSALVVAESQVTNLVTDLAGKLPQQGTYTTVRTNRVVNPSFETNTTGWLGTRATIALDSTKARFGSSSVKITVTDASAQQYLIQSNTAGLRATVSANETVGVVGSFWPHSSHSTFQFQLYVYDSAGTFLSVLASSTISVVQGQWNDLSATFTMPVSAASVRIVAQPVQIAPVSAEWWIDGVALGTGLTNFFDGSTTSVGDIAYAWTGTANASTSTQTVTTRNVGALDAQQLKIAGVDVSQQPVNVAKWSGASSSIVETASRVNLNIESLTSGTVLFSFFTPLVTTTVSNVSMVTATTAASGLTLARMGLYTFDEVTATLVAQTANDTTLFNATNSVYTRSFDTTGGYPATYTLQAGQCYALGIICVGTTMPSLYYQLVTTGIVSALPPRMTGSATSQTDLPTTRATFTNNAALMYGRFS